MRLVDAQKSGSETVVFDLSKSACKVPRESLVDEERQFNAGIILAGAERFIMAYRAGPLTDWNKHRVVLTTGRIEHTQTETFIELDDPGQSTYLTAESKYGWPGLHLEDPRLCWVPCGPAAGCTAALFVVYTDGSTVGVAKVDPSDFSTLYSQYVRKPASVQALDHTGLEKNWIPFSDGSPNTLYMLYSDTPRTIFKFTDNGSKLVYESVWAHKHIRCAFGNPRGGAPPVLWRTTENGKNEYIWFFHTNQQGTYHVGAYITVGFQSVRQITPVPLFSGARIVFQCGAIAVAPEAPEPCAYVLSAGLQDTDVVFLRVPRNGIPLVPVQVY
jgi:hypothetical protein